MERLPDLIAQYRAALLRNEPVRLTARNLLAAFDVGRRTPIAIAQIDLALRAAGLRTEPDFADAWIDDPLALCLLDPPAPPHPPQTPTPEPPALVALPSPTEPPARTTAAPASITPNPSEPASSLHAPSAAPTRARLRRIGAFAPGHRTPVGLTEGDTLEAAYSEMLLTSAPVLAVFKGKDRRKLVGALCWRDLAVALREVPSNTQLRTVLDRWRNLQDPSEISADLDVFAAATIIAERGFAFVRSERGPSEWSGPLTGADLTNILGPTLEPFVLAGEIEHTLRTRLVERLNRPEAASFTIGECQRELQKAAQWDLAGIPLDRIAFDRALDEVRRIRNELVHFNVDELPEADLVRLRTFHDTLRALIGSRP